MTNETLEALRQWVYTVEGCLIAVCNYGDEADLKRLREASRDLKDAIQREPVTPRDHDAGTA